MIKISVSYRKAGPFHVSRLPFHVLYKFFASVFLSCILLSASADTRLIRNLDIWDVCTYNYNASHWIEQGNLQTGQSMYGDVIVPITYLPESLKGADWIQTAYGSRSFEGTTIATFQLKEDAAIFIAHNKRILTKPRWLLAFTKTGEVIRNAAGEIFEVYKKSFVKNDSVRLGANGGPASMYMVIAKAKNAAAPAVVPKGPLFDVLQFGAVGDGSTLNTAALQRAIDACATAGGGSVYIHNGIFVTGTLVLKDNVTLFISPGTILRGSANHDDYPAEKCTFPYFRANEHYQLIYAEKRNHVGITGGGLIDGFSHGEGWPWKGRNNEYERPRLIRMVECSNVDVHDISLIRSANWTELYEGCDSVRVSAVRVRCYTGQNNEDGIDISSCNHVTVTNFYNISGDDGICLKAMSAKPTENIIVEGVLERYANCHAVKIGTETHGDVKNIHVKGVMANTRYGIAVESVDGSNIDGVVYENILMTHCSTPLFIRLGDRGRTYPGGPAKAPIGSMKNIVIRNVSNTGIGYVDTRNGPGVGSAIGGLPERKIDNLLIDHCDFLYYGSLHDTTLVTREVPENRDKYPEFDIYGTCPAYGLYIRHVNDITIRNTTIQCMNPDVRPAVVLDDVGHDSLSGLHCTALPITWPSAIWRRTATGTTAVHDSAAAGVAPGPRLTKVIDQHWTFNYFPQEDADRKNCQDPQFDDSKWPDISLPHTWQVYETTGELHPFIRNPAESDDAYWWKGWGWYRKHFIIAPSQAGKKVFIEFDGVQKYSKVYINGHYLGDHKGGYGSFDFDITGYIKPGADNVLAVAVNNLRVDPDSIPPMKAGNWNTYGGIYRNVRLVIKSPVYIPMQGSAVHEGGTFITTPNVSKESAVVRVRTYVQNDREENRECRIRTTITDSNNNVVQVLEQKVTIPAHALDTIDQLSRPITHPHLWAPGDPYVYKVHSEVYDGALLSDNYESPLGIRWFHWDYQNNYLYVNDRKIVLDGGNRHEEYPWLGEAVPQWITDSDYYDMAVNMNYNFMRTVHYPNDPHVYDLTDRYGIIIDEELPNDKNQVFSKEVQHQQLKEMIRRERNHPSILFWSMGNETDHAADSKWTLPEDTTRIITARRVLDHSEGDYAPHSDKNLGIESLLRCNIRGWYNKDVKDLEPEDGQHAGTEEQQHRLLIASGRLATGNLSTWLYADHGCDREYLHAPLKHVNPKGYVDAYRQPKYAYYIWQANYLQRPMVFILPHFWRPAYLGQKKDITVDANGEKVELFVNNVSQGIAYPSANNFHAVTFKDILIQKGALKAVATKGKDTVMAIVQMAGAPSQIHIAASHVSVAAEKSSIVLIKADILDKDGVHVYSAANPLTWKVTGPATLVGPAVYTTDIDKDEQMDGTMYTDAPVVNLIRSTGEPGNITVTVSSPGLVASSVTIQATTPKEEVAGIIERAPAGNDREQVAKNPSYHSGAAVATAGTPRTRSVIIQPTFDEFNMPGKTRQQYAAFITRYIVDKNKGIDTTTAAFKKLVDLFASHMAGNEGRLVADDYNFNIEQFNQDRLLVPYATIPGAVKSNSYTLFVNGREIFVEKFKDISYARFSFAGKASLQVRVAQDFRRYTLSPVSYAIVAEKTGNAISFQLNRSRKLIVQVEGLAEKLFIFADTLETEAPQPGDARVTNLLDYVKDKSGQTLVTRELQAAIDHVSAAGGGTLYVPDGKYLTGTFSLKKNVTLYLSGGALIQGSENINDYNDAGDNKTGRPMEGRGALIYLIKADNARIMGRGVIAMSGTKIKAATDRKIRICNMRECNNAGIYDVILRDAGGFNIHILRCSNITMQGYKIINDLNLPNEDGTDPDGSNGVVVKDVFMYTSDDAIAVKADDHCCENILVKDCVFWTIKSALKVGSDPYFGARNIVFQNNDIVHADRALALYSGKGIIEKVKFLDNRSEIVGGNAKRQLIIFQVSNARQDDPDASRRGTGYIKDVEVINYTAWQKSENSSVVEGTKGKDGDLHTVSDVLFKNMVIEGKHITSAGEANMIIDNATTTNIRFE